MPLKPYKSTVTAILSIVQYRTLCIKAPFMQDSMHKTGLFGWSISSSETV
jgi:hypothetical protein